MVEGKSYLQVFHGVLSEPQAHSCREQSCQTLHHVLFNMAVKQEVSPEGDLTRILRWMFLEILKFIGQELQRSGYSCIDNETLGWTQRVAVYGARRRVGDTPAGYSQVRYRSSGKCSELP